MSIIASRSADFVRVRFLPDPDDDPGLLSYSPWIIAPGMIQPPFVDTGGPAELHAGGCMVQLERLPPLPPAGRREAYSQPRRLWP